MAEDAIPKNFYEEDDVRVLERKIQLSKDAMARIYKQKYEMPQKLMYDMDLFETLVALKPFVAKMTSEFRFTKKTKAEDQDTIEAEYINPNEVKDEEIVTPETAEEDFFRQQTKKQLEERLALESGEAVSQKNAVGEELSNNPTQKAEEKLADPKAQNKKKISGTA